MVSKKNIKNLCVIVTIFALYGLGLIGSFWTADGSAAKSNQSTAGTSVIRALAPAATFPGIGVGAIPDATVDGTPGVPLVVSFVVSGITSPISSVAVNLTGTHTYLGDLDVVLAAPGGSPSHVIFSRVGATATQIYGSPSDLGGTYNFTDVTTANFWTAAAAVAGTDDELIAPGNYRTTAAGGAGQTNPAPVTNLTAAFSGLTTAQANGTWTLTFRDRSDGNAGTITAANLSILTGGTTPPSSISDGGFELNTGTTPVTNIYWSSTSTTFGSSLCTIMACGTTNGVAPPRTGNGWVRFDGVGGNATTAESGTVQQSIVFPNGRNISLNYYLRVGNVRVPSSSVLRVLVDGIVVQTINEPAIAETAYTLRMVNLSSFANGATRVLQFAYSRPAGTTGSDSFTIDDVSLVELAPTAASVSVAGRVTTAAGRGIRNVLITLTDTNGNQRTATSTAFGYYRFDDVPVGSTYIITAKGKRYEFTQSTRVTNVNDDTVDINFTANPD